MKTKEELDFLKEEVQALNEKLEQLSVEELEQVAGGFIPLYPPVSHSPNESAFNSTFDGNARTVNLNTDWGTEPQSYDCSGLIS